MGNDGIVVSDSEPTTQIGKFTWLQVLSDGSRKWFEKADGGWQLVKSEVAPAEVDHVHSQSDIDGLVDALDSKATASHSHPTHSDINFTGSVSADGDTGLTGQRTIAGYTLAFKKGLLVGFQAP